MSTYTLSGTTNRGADGVLLPSCDVHLFDTATDTEQGQTTSDASGAWSVSTLTSAGPYYAVAYLVGSPDLSGTTLNTLTATLSAISAPTLTANFGASVNYN